MLNRTWKLDWTLERMQNTADQRYIKRWTLSMTPDAVQDAECYPGRWAGPGTFRSTMDPGQGGGG